MQCEGGSSACIEGGRSACNVRGGHQHAMREGHQHAMREDHPRRSAAIRGTQGQSEDHQRAIRRHQASSGVIRRHKRHSVQFGFAVVPIGKPHSASVVVGRLGKRCLERCLCDQGRAAENVRAAAATATAGA
jgi:hypothetical protein